MRFVWCSVVLIASLIVVQGEASADTVTFDDAITAPGPLTVPSGYAGLNWLNAKVMDGASNYPGSGYENGTVSGDYVMFGLANARITIADGSFTWHGAYFTAAWNDGLTIDISGFAGTAELFSTSITVGTDGPTFFSFEWAGIDRLVLSSSGGTNAGLGNNGTAFVMDDFSFTAVPEPGTLALFGLSVAGLAWRRRRVWAQAS